MASNLEIPANLVRTSSFNIPNLAWDEPIYPLYATRVAEEIRVVLTLFAEQFNQTTEKALRSLARKIEDTYQEDYPPLRRHRRGSHSLVAFRERAPIFAALDPDPGRGDEGGRHVYSLERTVRLALLLHTTGYITLTKTLLLDASTFTHVFRYADKHGEHDPFGWVSDSYRETSARFLTYIKKQHWPGLVAAANTYLRTSNKKDDSYYSSIVKFGAIAEALAQRTWPVARKSWEPPPLFPTGDLERDRDGDIRTIVTFPEPDPRLPATNSRSQKALAVRGASMRLTCLWGDMSQEALHPLEATHCMRWLLSRNPQSEAEEIALVLWVLVGTTMHRFDNLLMGIGCEIPGKTPNPKLKVTIEGTRVTVSLPVIPNINFDSVPESSEFYFAETGSRVSLRVDLKHSNLNPDCLIKLARVDAESDLLLQDVLAAKDHIQQAIRDDACDVFTDNHFRSGLYQAVFTETRDIPLLQLITGELLGFSDAALHYAAFSSAQIQAALNAGLERQYGTMFTPAPAVDDVNLLIGAPTSAFHIQAIRSATTGLRMEMAWTNEELPTTARWVQAHNALIDYIGWLLIVTFGSRNQADLSALTLNQLSLNLGCAALYEKGSDPSIFRRVAVIPEFAMGEIYRLIVHLRQLAAQFGKSHATSYQTLRQHCLDMLNGDKPLLQTLVQDEDTELRFISWSGRTLVQELFPPGVAADICRHVMATRMRKKHPAALVEAQLGHAIGYDLYDRASIVDIPLLVKSLQGPLTDHLLDCGFDVKTVYVPPPTLAYSGHRPADWYTYHAAVSAIYREDGERIRKMRGTPTNQDEKSGARTAIERVLCDFCGVEDIERLPRRQSLSEDECKRIYREALGRVSGGVKALRATARAVKVRLKQLRDTHRWTVDLPPHIFWEIRQPPEVTHFHLQAYESLIALRIALSREEKPAQTNLLMSYFGLHIMIHGGAGSSWEEVYEVMRCADRAFVSPEMNALIVPIQHPVEESRSLSGLSMIALIGWRQHNRPTVSMDQFLAGIPQLLPPSWRGDCPKTAPPVEQLVQLARMVEIPPILANVESQKLSARALKAHRLIEYLAGTGNNLRLDDRVIQAPPDEPVELTPKTKDTTKYSQHLSALRKAIKRPLTLKELRKAGYDASEKKRERSRASIDHYLDKQRPPQLIQLLALWAHQILGPDAHLKKGGPLKEGTVLDYINAMSHLLRPILEHVNILNLEPEELHELIQDQLSEDENVREEQSFLLNRLFREVSLIADVPRLVFPTNSNTDPNSARKSIDADIVTPAENRYARTCLESWSRSPSVMASAMLPLREAVDLLTLSEQIGTRRNESYYLRHKDATSYGDTVIIKIRPSRRRTLKSKAARRRFLIGVDQLPERIEAPASAAPNDLIFANMTRRGLGIDPLQVASIALKVATGDPGSRLHRIRRTRVSDSFPDILDATDTIDRIYQCCKLTATTGHVSLLSTVMHYACTVYHLIGTRYTTPVQAYPYKYIESLAAVHIPNLAQAVYKYDNPRVLRSIIKRAGLPKPTLVYRKADPRIPSKIQPEAMDYPGIIDLIYTLFSRKDTLRTFSPKVSNRTLQAVVVAIDKLQMKTGLQVVSYEKTYMVHALYKSFEGELSEAHEQSRSQVSEACFQAWIRHLSELSESTVRKWLASLQAFSQYQIDRTCVYLDLEKQTASPERFNETVAALGLSLRLKSASFDDKWPIILTYPADQHVQLQTIKALLLSALVLATVLLSC